MYGVHLGSGRPASKKALKEQIARDVTAVRLESTNEHEPFNGRLDRAPAGEYLIVGPSPVKRNFYGTITVHADGRITVV